MNDMTIPTKTTLRTRTLLLLNAYWIGLSFLWNSLHVIVLPAVLLLMVPEDFKNTYLGLLTFLGLVLAMLVQPLAGAISDGWRSPLGRRRPFILGGTLVDLVFLALLGWSGGLAWLALGYIGLQLSSNVAHGAFQGLLPDQVPPEQLGGASAYKNLLDMLGLIAASLLMGRIYDPQLRHPIGPIALVAGVLALSAAATIFGVHEAPATEASRPDPSGKPLWKMIARIDWKQHRPFAWLIAARLAFLTAIYGVQVFAQYYLGDVLAVENPVRLTGDLLAAISVALVLFSVAGGWLGDRFGHRRVAYAAGIIGALGCLLLLGARTPQTVLVFGAVLGVGIGLFLTSNWALLNQLAPPGEAGLFMGLTNLATAGAGAIGRLEGPLIDLGNQASPGNWLGYSGLFLFGAVCIVLSIFLLFKAGAAVETANASITGSEGVAHQ